MIKRPKSLILVLILGLVMVGYNNCSNVEFAVDTQGKSNGNPATNDNDANNNLDNVQKTCMNSVPQVAEYTVSYINPENQSCNFGIGDNLPPRDGYFQGHIDQVSNFSMPAGSTICGMTFEFPTLQMRYDDHFLLTFNGVVIAGTFDFSSDLDHLLGMNLYSWEKIRGTDWHNRTNLEGVHCEGKNYGKASCSWPATDTFGSINMSFDGEIFQKIFALNPTRTNHAFNLVTIGDNDANDCEVSPITFKVKVSYAK